MLRDKAERERKFHKEAKELESKIERTWEEVRVMEVKVRGKDMELRHIEGMKRELIK
jgi:hypothetical protein